MIRDVNCGDREMSCRCREFSYRDVLILTAIWLISRVFAWSIYQPIEFPDTETYKQVSQHIAELSFEGYIGQRTPIYPLFIHVLGLDGMNVWVFQSLMGLATILMAYGLLMIHGVKSSWCVTAGAAIALSLNLIFFEPAMATECMSAFVLMLVIYLLATTIKKSGVMATAAVALLIGLAVLLRPQFIVLIPAAVLTMLLFLEKGRRKNMVVLVVVSMIPVLGWSAFNERHTGVFSVTTLTGFNLSNHTGAFIEAAPDQYAEIRDIYLKYRDEKLANGGTQAMVIFSARREIMDRTGMSEVELSQTLVQMSVGLIKENPLSYLKSVSEAWVGFWMVPNYWNLDLINAPSIKSTLSMAWGVEQTVLRMVNVVFVVFSAALFVMIIRAHGEERQRLLLPVLISLTVIGMSVLQALLEYGENPRYFISAQPVVMVACFYAAWIVFEKYGRDRGGNGRGRGDKSDSQ